MHRFYLPPELCRESHLALTDSEAHHAHQVLRLDRGERVVVLDGAGHEFLCQVQAAARHRVELAMLQRHDCPPLPCRLTLIQAITKQWSMDLIVQKATELGAARIVPILSERSVPRIDPAEGARKVEKWRALAVEAIKQCGTPWLPQIDLPNTPTAFLAKGTPSPLTLLASLQPGARHPSEPLAAHAEEHGAPARDVAVWVGPEGDFTPAELNQIRSAGAHPISLGPLVLRSETAAIYCLSVLAYELQRKPPPVPQP